MEIEIKAYNCRSFEEYNEDRTMKDDNLIFGDGKCPGVNYIINEDFTCPKDCKFYEELK